MILKTEIKKKKQKTREEKRREAACACAADPGQRHSGVSSQKKGLQEENPAQPDKPHFAESLKMCPAGRCTCFLFFSFLFYQISGPWTELWLTLEVSPVRVKQGLRWVKGKKEGKTVGGMNNNRRKSEDRLYQRNRSRFVRARITSSATRNQTAGSGRTWLSGFLQEGGKKRKKKKMMVMSSALVDVIDISFGPQWFPAGPTNTVFMSAALVLRRLHSAQQSIISGHQHLIHVITVSKRFMPSAIWSNIHVI